MDQSNTMMQSDVMHFTVNEAQQEHKSGYLNRLHKHLLFKSLCDIFDCQLLKYYNKESYKHFLSHFGQQVLTPIAFLHYPAFASATRFGYLEQRKVGGARFTFMYNKFFYEMKRLVLANRSAEHRSFLVVI